MRTSSYSFHTFHAEASCAVHTYKYTLFVTMNCALQASTGRDIFLQLTLKKTCQRTQDFVLHFIHPLLCVKLIKPTSSQIPSDCQDLMILSTDLDTLLGMYALYYVVFSFLSTAYLHVSCVHYSKI